MSFKTIAYIHSLQDKKNNIHVLGECEILEHTGNNNVIAEYQGNKYKAIYNVFVDRYYVDDVYGKIEEVS